VAEGGGDLAGLAEIEAFEGLVDQQRGLGRQEADGKKDTLSLAFGERADGLM